MEQIKFDAIVGNPPYHINDANSAKGSAKPIYQYFIENAIKIQPEYVSLITPSVWFKGGKGLDDFRKKMMNDSKIDKVYNFITPQDIFSNVNLRGGVNFFLWNNNKHKNENFTMVNINNNQLENKSDRPLVIEGLDIIVTDNIGYKMITRLNEEGHISFNDENKMFSKHISARNPFNFTTLFTKTKDFSKNKSKLKNPVKIYASKGNIGYVERDLVNKNFEWIDKYKVITPFANNIGTDLNDDNLNAMVSQPGTICTESYLVIGADMMLNEEKAQNIIKYLETKFVRYLINLAKANQNGTAKTYKLVPNQNFDVKSDIDWSLPIAEIDKQLFKKYKLEHDEILYIEKAIKPMEQ